MIVAGWFQPGLLGAFADRMWSCEIEGGAFDGGDFTGGDECFVYLRVLIGVEVKDVIKNGA